MEKDTVDTNNATRQANRKCKIAQIESALRDYHNALDLRKHGGLAAGEFVSAVETILDMPWEREATLRLSHGEISTTATLSTKEIASTTASRETQNE